MNFDKKEVEKRIEKWKGFIARYEDQLERAKGQLQRYENELERLEKEEKENAENDQ